MLSPAYITPDRNRAKAASVYANEGGIKTAAVFRVRSCEMNGYFIKVGNIFINLSRVEVIRDYPEAKETLIVFADRQASELLGGRERDDLLHKLSEHLFVPAGV